MRELVELPDAEAVVIGYLLPLAEEEGLTIDVRGGGGRHVRVRRVGGVEVSPAHDSPTVDVLVWHDGDRSRMRVAQRLWAALRAADGDTAGGGVLLYASTVLGPRQMPDPADETKTVCMFTVSLITRSA